MNMYSKTILTFSGWTWAPGAGSAGPSIRCRGWPASWAQSTLASRSWRPASGWSVASFYPWGSVPIPRGFGSGRVHRRTTPTPTTTTNAMSCYCWYPSIFFYGEAGAAGTDRIRLGWHLCCCCWSIVEKRNRKKKQTVIRSHVSAAWIASFKWMFRSNVDVGNNLTRDMCVAIIQRWKIRLQIAKLVWALIWLTMFDGKE